MPENAAQLDPLEGVAVEVERDDDLLHPVQEQPGRSERAMKHLRVLEMRELGAAEVRRAEHLVSVGLEVVKDEINHVSVNATRRHSEGFLRVVPLSVRQARPRSVELLRTDLLLEVLVLELRGDALENEDRVNLRARQHEQLPVDRLEHARWRPADGVREWILQHLNGSQPIRGIDPDPQVLEIAEAARLDKPLILERIEQLPHAHLRAETSKSWANMAGLLFHERKLFETETHKESAEVLFSSGDSV